MSLKLSFCIGLLFVGLAGGLAFADSVYVATDGDQQGDGSPERPLDIETAFGPESPAAPGDTILLKGGVYDGRMDGIERIPFTITVSGDKDAPITIKPVEGENVHLNGTVTLDGNYIHIYNLEIGDLNWDRFREEHQNSVAFAIGEGGAQSKLINCNLFGGRQGSAIWRRAVDFEMYGCLIHDFGTQQPGNGSGSGHAVYTQNEEGTMRFENNMFYRGCGWNFNIYTEGASIRGYDVINNMSFAGGWYVPEKVSFSYGVAGHQPAERLRFIGNLAYQPRYGEKWRGNFRLIVHGISDLSHKDAEVRDNYIMGAWRGLSLGRFEDLVATDNTIWSRGVMTEIAVAPGGSAINDPDAGRPDKQNYEVDNNTYYANDRERPFRYGTGMEAEREEDVISFEDWQALGFDENSEMLPARDGKPTGVDVFVFPNKYEEGRAHIGVFNWDGEDAVEVDISEALEEGQQYRIYNVLDIDQTIKGAHPVVEGEFDGEKVSLPMKGDEASPDFDAFLLLPG